MKNLALVLIFSFFSLTVFANEESRSFRKLNEKEAEVEIKTEETDSTQAAVYADGLENDAFIKMLLKDRSSSLALLRAKMEMDNCGEVSTDDNPWIDGCGEVTITKEVRTSFGRGGWMSGGAEYTFFVGFTEAGTGHFFTATHMCTFFEEAVAQVNAEENYNGIVLKHLSFEKITELKN